MTGIESIESMTQFGVAGLMGALWLWERFYSRRREQELTQAHQHLMAKREELEVLTTLVQRNTEAVERFERTQAKLADLIERLADNREAV